METLNYGSYYSAGQLHAGASRQRLSFFGVPSRERNPLCPLPAHWQQIHAPRYPDCHHQNRFDGSLDPYQTDFSSTSPFDILPREQRYGPQCLDCHHQSQFDESFDTRQTDYSSAPPLPHPESQGYPPLDMRHYQRVLNPILPNYADPMHMPSVPQGYPLPYTRRYQRVLNPILPNYASPIHMPPTSAFWQPLGTELRFSPQRLGSNTGMGPYSNTAGDMRSWSMYGRQLLGPLPPPHITNPLSTVPIYQPLTSTPARHFTYQASQAIFSGTSRAPIPLSQHVTSPRLSGQSTPSSHIRSIDARELQPLMTGLTLQDASSASLPQSSKVNLQLFEEVKVEDLPEPDRSCPICYVNFGVKTPEGIRESPLRISKCRHVFGDRCIELWLEEPNSDRCPYCNQDI